MFKLGSEDNLVETCWRIFNVTKIRETYIKKQNKVKLLGYDPQKLTNFNISSTVFRGS